MVAASTHSIAALATSSRPPEEVAQGLSWKTKSLDFDNCMTVNFCLWNVLFMSNKPPKKCRLSSVKNDHLKTRKNDRDTEFGITLNYNLALSRPRGSPLTSKIV